MRTFRFIFCSFIFVLSGCTAPEPDAATIQAASRPVTCIEGADCNAKWSRAVNWVTKNSAWKIQNQTDNLIETFNPTEGSTDVGLDITKVAIGSGKYEIQFVGSCANMFGCIPNATVMKASFISYVLATE